MDSKIGAINTATFPNGDVYSKSASNLPAVSTKSAQNDELSFGSVLSRTFDNAMNDLRNAEVASFKGIEGTATTREVVDAVMQAERTLQTAIAMRDKLSSAFFEIAKMQL